MTMAANNRANARSPGRTPPFILVGLVVLVGFLGFNYWSLSSANSELTTELESVRVEKRDADQKNSEVEKNLESTREELRQIQGNLDATRKQLQERDNELNSAKTDFTNKVADYEELKKNLDKCDNVHAEDQKALEDITAKKNELEQILDQERQKPQVCDMGSCSNPVREVLYVASQLVGSDAMAKALAQAQIDPSKLMEGIQFPAPAVQQLAANQQNQQQQGDPNQQQNAGQNQQPVAGSQADGNTEPKKKEDIKEMNIADNHDIPKELQTDSVKPNETLVFESDKDKGVSYKEAGKENENKGDKVGNQEDMRAANDSKVDKVGDEMEANAIGENDAESDTVTTTALPTAGDEIEADDENDEMYEEDEEEEEEDGDNQVHYEDRE